MLMPQTTLDSNRAIANYATIRNRSRTPLRCAPIAMRMLVGGLNMAGTQTAADFLLDPGLMQPVLEHARALNGSSVHLRS